MSEPTRSAQEAGALLREARLKQNLHIAALAASIKVAPAKLEALEAGRFDELPDATFARALAQSVCRVLKIDAQPVLSLLPTGAAAALEKVDSGLNTPFRERQGRVAPADWLVPRQPALWLALLLIGAAAAFALMPGSWVGRWLPSPGEVPTAGVRVETTVIPSGTESSASAPASVEAAVPAAATSPSAAPLDAPAASMPAAAAPAVTDNPVAAATPPAAAATSGAATQLTARQATWVQASDAKGQVLLSRTVQAGEVVELTGVRPLRLRIGNVRGTDLVDRGQPVDLASRTRDNVLNLELP